MADVKQRMLDIVDSVPKDFFDGLKPTEMVFKLMFEYIDRYGEDETTLYDFIYNLVFFISLKESEDDIKNGRVMTIEESKERLMQEYEHLNLE